MPRTPTIRYFASRQAYYTQFQGRQHLLAAGEKDEPDGPVYRKACDEFARVMHTAELERSPADRVQVAAVISRYYFLLEREGRKKTQRLARGVLDSAIAAFGNVHVRDLRQGVIQDWLAGMADPVRAETGGRPWGQSTVATAIRVLHRAFAVAKEQGSITVNPVAGMKTPAMRSRGVEVVLPDVLAELVLATANHELTKFLRLLWKTGARPGEIIYAECSDYDPALGAIVYRWNAQPPAFVWKNARRTKRDRIIYLAEPERRLIEEEIARSGGRGRILRTPRRKKGLPCAWKPTNLGVCVRRVADKPQVQALCADLGFNPANILPYSFRHSWITRMLLAGTPIKLVADMAGTSVAMVEKVYSHAADDRRAMRGLFDQFIGRAFAGAGPASGEPRP